MKGIGIIKKLSAIILTVTLVFCMFNFTVACGNDEPQGYSFPTHSDPIKDGAYFITDAGFEVYNHEHPEYEWSRTKLYVTIQNNKIWLNECGYLFELLCRDGINIGKLNGFNDSYEIKLAIIGNMLYIDGWYGIGQYKLDSSYTISTKDEQKLESLKDYIIEIDTDQIRFIGSSPIGYNVVCELQPTGENHFKIIKLEYPFLGSTSINLNIKDFNIGKNLIKLYVEGGPRIDFNNKIVHSYKNSRSLLFEVYVNEDYSVTVTEIQ